MRSILVPLRLSAPCFVPRTTTPRRPQGIQSLEVAGRLLQALSRAGQPMMLKDLAADAAMPAAKAHRYLVSFQRIGLVEQDAVTGRYDLGPGALELGLAALARIDPIRFATPLVSQLTAELDATVALAVWGSRGPTIVRWEDSARDINVHLRAGAVMPLLSSATGRAFATWMPDAALVPMLSAELERARRAGRHDIPATREAFERMRADVRRHGIARVKGQLLPGIHALSAPVFDHRGAMVLALTALGHAGAFDADWDGAPARRLRRAALDLSHRLGWHAPQAG
jgi:DNA-binding IclR family transcriptional regulator